MRLMIIWGSSRQGRMGGTVVDWVKRQASADKRFEVDFVDLRELNLPFFDEPISPFNMKEAGADYVHPEGKVWAERVGQADGYIIVTPEYNAGYTGVLKNALDWVGVEWDGKTVGLVSYGGKSGGGRALGQLGAVVADLGMKQIPTTVQFIRFRQCFDDQGQPISPEANDNLTKVLDSLAASGKNL